jgi:hypothetical protein
MRANVVHLPALDLLRARVTGASPGLVLLAGPARSGKTVMLRQLLAGRPGTMHWEVPPLEEQGLLRDLDRLVAQALGELPRISRPDLLPLRGSGHDWAVRLEGLLRGVAVEAEAAGRGPGILAIDGMDALAGGGRRAEEALLEAWHRIRGDGAPVHLVLTWRVPPPLEWTEAAESDGAGVIEPGDVPFRVAAACHGAGWGAAATDPRGALARWCVFGGRPDHLPTEAPAEGGESRAADPGADWRAALEAAVVRRVLSPGGDLHDAPLRRLEATYQVPRRYLGILAALAAGETDWGGIASRVGADVGNRLAPYLQALEAGGWIRVRRPLDGTPGGRRRRYVLADPFTDFWLSQVLPVRSLLHRADPGELYRTRIAPHLWSHEARWLPELARRWVDAHAREALPAAAREVGGLWAGPAEVEVAARLANGQVCYGACDPGNLPAAGGDEGLLDRLETSMGEVRWGMGREARAPLVFLLEEPSDALRRRVARTALGRILTPRELFGGPS